jgi:anti-sigma regulatory factor (Ser/Thr protein kinase)
MSDHTVRLTFPAKPDYLLLARLALSGLTRAFPLGDETLADLKLAVTEACGNAVRHAYPEGSGGDVSISYVLSDGALEMIVEDQGRGIEPRDVSEEPFASPLESGMGISIIRTIVDDLDIQSGADGRGTVVRMSKRLDAASA